MPHIDKLSETLIYAAKEGENECVKSLIQLGADMNHMEDYFEINWDHNGAGIVGRCNRKHWLFDCCVETSVDLTKVKRGEGNGVITAAARMVTLKL